MAYKVIIAIKNGWWSDQKTFDTLSAASRHRVVVETKWNDCDTAITNAADHRVLLFRESVKERQELARILAAN